MGYTLTFSAPPALQGFAAYYGGQQAAERQTQDTQARIDAQNDAQLNSALAGLTSGIATGGLAGYYYNQAQQAAPGTYAADGMGPPAPGDPAAYQRNMMLAQYALGGPQAASGYLANQEQFRNRMIAQNDAQSFSGEQNRLNREQNQTQFDARLKFRENDREDSQQFQQDYLQQQFAGKLGTTTAGLYDTGVQSVIAQGGDPATMSREQIMGIGMQTAEQQRQVRDLTNRNSFASAQAAQAEIAKNTKYVYTRDQKQKRAAILNGLAQLESDERYFNPQTGLPTPLGLNARRDLNAALAGIKPRPEFNEPPPSLGETLGIIQPVPAQGPPTPSQVSPMGVVPGQQPSSGQYQSPYGEVLVNGTGVAAIQLPNGKMMTFHNDGQKVNMRVEDVKTPQSGGFTPGEPVVRNGREVGFRKENGGVEWTPDYVLKMENPPEGPSSRPKHFGFFEDEEKAGKFVLDAFEATTRIKVPQYDSEGNQLEPRSPSLEEVTSALSNVLSTVSDTSKMDVRQAENKYQDVIANNPYDASTRADMAIQMIAGGQRKLSDFAEAHPAVQREIQSRLGGIIANAQSAATNQSQQPYEREFRKKSDGPNGPLYIGLYDPATGDITNERLKQ